MESIKNHLINGLHGKPILADVFYKADGKAKPIVIFSHGFKGFKDWGHFNLVGKAFAEAGMVFVKFNFSHNGTTVENPLEFGDLEAFGNNNYIIELDDLKLVVDWILGYEPLHGQTDPEQLFLIGHSRGGGISVLKAAEDARVKKLCTWAAVSDILNRNKQRTIETWKKNGVIHARNGRTQQDMPLYLQFYETQLQHKERLNILKAARQLAIPFLIIHGTNDEAVSSNDATDLRLAAPHSELVMIDGANHTFETRHPYTDSTLTGNAELVVNRTISFFKS